MKYFLRLTEFRLRLARFFSIALFAMCFARAGYLCLFQVEFLHSRARQQHMLQVSAPPERASIVDRNGQILALTLEAADVYIRPAKFKPQTAPLVAEALQISPELVRQRADVSAPFVWLGRNVPRTEAAKLASLRLEGVGTEPARRRVYPMGPLAGQVLGTVGVDLEGLAGLELKYDRFLRVNGQSSISERDARGRRMKRQLQQPARNGSGGFRLQLTLDATLQRFTEASLKKGVERSRALQGLALVLDPQSGEVLALAHYPEFDPNHRRDASRPNARPRAVTDPFEPGSTMKAFTVAAGLEEGVIAPEDRLYCERGRYRVGNRVIRDHGRYEWLSIADVLRHSSNICSAKIGEKLGAERLHAALTRFGFDRITSVDLPGEKTYPLRPWSKWARIQLVTTSFGQGVAVTPMQLAVAYAALANGGQLVRPYVVKRATGPDGAVVFENRPQVVGRATTPEVAATLSRFLEGVVESGTGKEAQIRGVRVAGKTGTAQKVEIGSGRYSTRDRIASFIGFFPVESPRFVILVIIDTPRTATYGGVVAAPVFREIGEFAADHFGLRAALGPQPLPPPPLPSGAPSLRRASWTAEEASRGMPSFLGLGLREALQQAQTAGWEVEVSGWGFVTKQDPPPGSLAAPNRKLRLTLAPPASG